jgi:hypothetical protein
MLPSAETSRDSQAMSSPRSEQSAARETCDAPTFRLAVDCVELPRWQDPRRRASARRAPTHLMRAARSEYDVHSVRTADASDIGLQHPARYGQNDREIETSSCLGLGSRSVRPKSLRRDADNRAAGPAEENQAISAVWPKDRFRLNAGSDGLGLSWCEAKGRLLLAASALFDGFRARLDRAPPEQTHYLVATSAGEWASISTPMIWCATSPRSTP